MRLTSSIHAALQKVALDVVRTVINKGKLVKAEKLEDVASRLRDKYHTRVEDRTDGDGDVEGALQIVENMLSELANSGDCIRHAVEGYGLLDLVLYPGEHVERPALDSVEQQPTSAFAEYEKSQAVLRIAVGAADDKPVAPTVGNGAHNVGRDFRTVLAHELGHLCMESCEEAAGKKFKVVFDSQPPEYWSQHVSEYAAKSDRELFGECFAAFTSNRYRGNLPVEVADFFELASIKPSIRKARRNRSTADSAVDSADWSPVSDVIKQDLLDQFMHAAKVEYDVSDTDISFDIFNQASQDYAEDRAASLVTDISNTTRRHLRDSVSNAVESGMSNVEFARELADTYDFSEERSLAIARTELAFADSAGHQSVAGEAGAVGKQWLLASDPCDECQANADEGVIAYDDTFQSGDDFAPAHTNCSCDFEAIYPDDERAQDLMDDEDDDTEKVLKAQVDAAAHAASTSSFNLKPLPTKAQAHAGNYPKGHVHIAGLDLSVENPAGSARRYTTSDGAVGVTELSHHYGYIRGTVGNDGDHVDILIRQGMDDGYSGPVFVVDQYIDGKFDEHKCLIGFATEMEARNAYLDQYQPGWKGLKSITQLSIEDFKQWLKTGDMSKPCDPNI